MKRDDLAERQNGYCWWCGRSLPAVFAVHHRKLRKHGGTNSPANLLCLCHVCHNGDTNSVHLQPSRAYQRGFLVHSWETPAEVPVKTTGVQLIYLDDNGDTHKKEEENVW